MYDEKQKPILDLGVYTKNRAFRLPGSSKFEDYTKLAFPKEELFMNTIISKPHILDCFYYVPKVDEVKKGVKKGIKQKRSGER